MSKPWPPPRTRRERDLVAWALAVLPGPLRKLAGALGEPGSTVRTLFDLGREYQRMQRRGNTSRIATRRTGR